MAPIDNIKSPDLLKIVNEASRAKGTAPAATTSAGGASSAPPTPSKGKGGEDSDEEGEGLFTKKNWIKDEEASACMNCSTPFTFMNRRVRAHSCIEFGVTSSFMDLTEAYPRASIDARGCILSYTHSTLCPPRCQPR